MKWLSDDELEALERWTRGSLGRDSRRRNVERLAAEVRALRGALRLLTEDGPDGEVFECSHGAGLREECFSNCEFNVVRSVSAVGE